MGIVKKIIRPSLNLDQAKLRMNVRNFLLTANRKDLLAELDMSSRKRDWLRCLFVTELLEECQD